MSEQDRLFLDASLAENGMPISAGGFPPTPRRVVVRLTDGERADPAARLAAVETALTAQGVALEWVILNGGPESTGIRAVGVD